jgi:hypothetical protein
MLHDQLTKVSLGFSGKYYIKKLGRVLSLSAIQVYTTPLDLVEKLQLFKHQLSQIGRVAHQLL